MNNLSLQTNHSEPAQDTAPADLNDEFFDAQKLDPSDRGASFEALYFRQLQRVILRIHNTDDIDQIMLETSSEICRLLNADRLTIYVINDDQTSIISKVKTGLNASRDLRLPITTQSIAGYVALSQMMVNIADVYDVNALHAIHADLHFLREVDKRSGYRTKQMLVAPMLYNGSLYGVLQVINNRSGQPFCSLDEEAVKELCITLAIALRQRMAENNKDEAISFTKPAPYDLLVSDGLLSGAALSEAQSQARIGNVPIEPWLITKHQIQPAQLGASLAKFFNVVYEPYNAGRIRSEMLHGVLKRDFLESQGWIPLEETTEGLVIMCLDPEAVRAARVVPQVYPRHNKFAYRVTTQQEFEQTLLQLFGSIGSGHSIDQMLANMDSPLDGDSGDDPLLLQSAAADNELVKFVNKVIVDAYNQRVSDIHIEPMPGRQKTGIRFRIDGALQPYIEVPAQFRQAMVTRLKIMCDLDISEKRKPQDGKIKFKKYGPLDIELRVATIPSTGGMEDVVMRILSQGEPVSIDKLGLTERNRALLQATIARPHGLFYVCGPTGSGKTTTLHSILKFLNTSDTKIWTAEDPVEITQKGLRQVQINKKAGIDFAMVMRSFLRADPDIIMVGESRDQETVSMGIEASLTGHRVFSTLHTNSAPESIVRLLDMGMDPYNFSDALLGILAQRLAKKLCSCKEATYPNEEEIAAFIQEYAEELRHTESWKNAYAEQAEKLLAEWRQLYGDEEGRLKIFKPVGCDICNKTGYKGRIGLHELMVADEELKKQIQERARVSTLFKTALSNGMRTLKMDGMEKVLMGLTDLRVVRSVCAK